MKDTLRLAAFEQCAKILKTTDDATNGSNLVQLRSNVEVMEDGSRVSRPVLHTLFAFQNQCGQ